MAEEQLIRKRILELADRAYNNNYYTYTDFLGLAEVAVLNKLRKNEAEMKGINVYLHGGTDGCERVIAAFGDKDSFGYEPQFPIKCIEIKPLNIKYADKLTHRDYLGSIINLGIEREVIGDIVVYEDRGYMFCLDNMAGYITSELIRIKHTSVRCLITDTVPDIMENAVRMSIQISSERIDACIAKAYKMSRSDAVSLIAGRKVFVNGVQCESNSYTPRENDIISVRGYGRFRYIGIKKSTNKGNYISEVIKW